MSDQSTKTPQTSRRDRAILALLENPTLEKAAEVVGVHPTTLRRWLRQPDFHQALQQARHEAFSQSMRRLQQGANPAVGTLFRIMADAGTPASSRVRAAQCVLELCRNNIELEDIEVRLARLESLSSNGVPRQKA
jgi:transposase-like protein